MKLIGWRVCLYLVLFPYDAAKLTDDIAPIMLVPQRLSNWKSINPENVYCREENKHYNVNTSFIPLILHTPDLESLHLETKGYICESFIYEVTCYKGFFGSVSLQRKIYKHQISHNDCIQALLEYETDISQTPMYPLEICQWMQTNSVQKTNIIIHPHSVSYDPYTNSYIDSLFPTSKCNQQFCPTINDNELWISSEKNISLHCNSFKPTPVKLYLTYQRVPFYIETLSGIREYLSKSCKLDLCGHVGFSTDNHHFYYSNDTDILELFPICSNREAIKIETNPNEDNIYRDYLSLKHELSCILSVERIKRINHVTINDLYNLTPLTEGFYPIYRLVGSQLQISTGHWFYVYHISKNSTHVAGIKDNGETIYWGEWSKTLNTSIEVGFGGSFRLGDKIYLPHLKEHLLLQEYLKIESLNQVTINRLHYSEHNYKKDLEDSLTYFESSHSYNPTISEFFQGLWSSTWGKLFSIFVSVIVITGSLAVLIKLIKLFISKPSENIEPSKPKIKSKRRKDKRRDINRKYLKDSDLDLEMQDISRIKTLNEKRESKSFPVNRPSFWKEDVIFNHNL